MISQAMLEVCRVNRPGVKATVVDDGGTIALKAEAVTEEGVIIAKASKAGSFDRENERIPLAVLREATYELVRNIGTAFANKSDEYGVDINHDKDAIKCDVLMAWIGYPMPDPEATYVALRPNDPAIVEAAKAGQIVGMSWSGPYKLRKANL